MERYNFKEIENKWQKIWDEDKVFKTDIDKTKKKFYNKKKIKRRRD